MMNRYTVSGYMDIMKPLINDRFCNVPLHVVLKQQFGKGYIYIDTNTDDLYDELYKYRYDEVKKVTIDIQYKVLYIETIKSPY